MLVHGPSGVPLDRTSPLKAYKVRPPTTEGISTRHIYHENAHPVEDIKHNPFQTDGYNPYLNYNYMPQYRRTAAPNVERERILYNGYHAEEPFKFACTARELNSGTWQKPFNPPAEPNPPLIRLSKTAGQDLHCTMRATQIGFTNSRVQQLRETMRKSMSMTAPSSLAMPRPSSGVRLQSLAAGPPKAGEKHFKYGFLSSGHQAPLPAGTVSNDKEWDMYQNRMGFNGDGPSKSHFHFRSQTMPARNVGGQELM